MSTEHFIDDDPGYLKWLSENPDGYVVNSHRTPRPVYVVLHRATCKSISVLPAGGRYWTDGYRKTCDKSRPPLDRWAVSLGGTLSANCACNP